MKRMRRAVRNFSYMSSEKLVFGNKLINMKVQITFALKQ